MVSDTCVLRQIYDLATGKVLEWVPKNGNPLRAVLGAIKGSVKPEKLSVYPTQLEEDTGRIFVKLDDKATGDDVVTKIE